jgi:rRNA maturation endonuclease Nob1|tara:strand:+ start:522 stop:695 length:174 start_codon:yes stop_codon:yes gene_type:complete
MKKKGQVFRFCCGCSRVTLMTEYHGCYFCGSKFVVAGKTDDFNIRKRKHAEAYEGVS